jgi:alkyldihydroxyacetonephosphate synthase
MSQTPPRGSSIGSAPNGLSPRVERIIPPPPTIGSDEVESDVAWGFADTSFGFDAEGRVMLTGSRYAVAGQPLPTLLSWFAETMDVPLMPEDRHTYTFPPQLPESRRHAAFEADIAGRLKADQISLDGLVRLRRGHGHTQEEVYNLKHGQLSRIPDMVVFPESDADVAHLVEAAVRHGVVLIPYGGGTNVTDALRCPEHETRTIISVDMKRMNRIRWIDPVNRLACIEAGAVGRHIASQLKDYGFTIGHEPDSIEFSTLGGWVATRASGMKKNRYGNIENIVLDLTAVTAQGVLERRQAAPRESVGLEPRHWMFGSEGTLGIITSAVVKLFPLPEVQSYDSVLFHDFSAGLRFMYELAQEGDWPASVRLVDNVQFQFSLALKPVSTGLKAAKSKLEKALVMGLMGFDPNRLVACTFVFEGSADDVARQQRRVKRLAKKHQGMLAGGENGSRGYQLTFGIAYIRDFVLDHWVLAESFETSVPWSQLEDLVESVKKRIYSEHAALGLPGKPFVTARVTQIYETGACVYFYLAYYYKGVANPTEVYLDLETAARDEVLRCGGSLSHHHGIGKLRRKFMPQIASGGTLACQAIAKQALDPTNVFANGNQVPPSLASVEHPGALTS